MDANSNILQQSQILRGDNQYNTSNNTTTVDSDLNKTLDKLNISIEKLDKDIIGMSQTNAREAQYDRLNRDTFNRRQQNPFWDTSDPWAWTGDAKRRKSNKYGKGFTNQFTGAFTDTLMEAAGGKELKEGLTKAIKQFTGGLADNISDVPAALGENLAKSLMNSPAGKKAKQAVADGVTNIASSLLSKGGAASGAETSSLLKSISSIFGSSSGAAAGGQATSLVTHGGTEFAFMIPGATAKVANLGAAAGTAGEGLTAVGTASAAAIPPLLAIGAALLALDIWFDQLTEGIEPAVDGIKSFGTVISTIGGRYWDQASKNLQAAQKRLQSDIETIITEPFEILKDAAQNVYNAWDSNLRLITATQGYDKAELQDLVASFAERLRAEGLTDVVSSSNILENLSSVLKSGLSGAIAEEFAYQATLLGAAIPSQDFFDYAATYSSIAANAVKDGASQSAAIALANKSLSEFANNLVYASRELAGGYTTGLTNAQSIYEQAVRITQAAKMGDVSEISGVLTSVSAIVGAIAPDLANSITDAVYNAATGGNSSSLVALRSLAGVNASNTEFLRALAQNPKQIFSNLFTTLSNMYASGGDAFMEKAEGYADLFGLSSEAFQRIDFAYLASAISQMNTSSNALNQNMELLVSGQTTLTKEQLVNRQINEYMLEEGLTYVLDNEAARAIQQHMWDEQLAREMQASTYGVELQGAALTALLGIGNAVSNIIKLISPLEILNWSESLAAVGLTAAELNAMKQDVANVVRAGALSKNATAYKQLTTYNRDLNLIQPLATLLGSKSNYAVASAISSSLLPALNESVQNYYASAFGLSTMADGFTTDQGAAVGYLGDRRARSAFNWKLVSKSLSTATQSALGSATESLLGLSALSSSTSATSLSQAALKNKFDKMVSESYMKSFLEGNKSYEEWAASSKQLGITDFTKAAEDLGYTEQDLRNFYQNMQTNRGVQENTRIREHEELYRQTGIDFWTIHFPEEFRDPLFEKVDLTNELLTTNNELLTTTNELLTQANSLLNFNNELLLSILDRHDQWLERWTEFKSGDNHSWDAHYDNLIMYGEKLKEHVKNFADYFIRHIYYDRSGYDYNAVKLVQQAEKSETGDAIYALAEALTKNTIDLKDPTVQTNAILSEILKVVNAIMVQNNDTAGTVSLADTLSALSMGVTNSI